MVVFVLVEGFYFRYFGLGGMRSVHSECSSKSRQDLVLLLIIWGRENKQTNKKWLRVLMLNPAVVMSWWERDKKHLSTRVLASVRAARFASAWANF